VNEARPGGQPKWGYVSHTPGDRLTLRIARDPEPGAAARSDSLPCIALHRLSDLLSIRESQGAEGLGSAVQRER